MDQSSLQLFTNSYCHYDLAVSFEENQFITEFIANWKGFKLHFSFEMVKNTTIEDS
jgi:hypothetical protein